MNAIVPPPMSMVRAIRHLCAVDLRRFRWFVSGVVGIELVRALLVESALHLGQAAARSDMAPEGAEVFLPVLDLATVVITAIATAILVQADHPTNDRAFWRSRPIPPIAVAWAKVLSMTLLFVLVPAAINAARLAAYGAPFTAIGAATVQIAVLAGVIVVPAWFLAVITHTLPRFLGGMLGVVIVGYFMLGTVMMLIEVPMQVAGAGGIVPFVFDWQHTGLHGWWGGAISTAVGLAIVAAHYRIRRLKVTVAGLLGLVLIPSLVPASVTEQPAPADLASLVDGKLTLPDGMSQSSYSGDGRHEARARIDGRVASPSLPRDVSAAVSVTRIGVRANGFTVPAEGREQCCLGAGPMGVLVPTATSTPGEPGNGIALFTVPASAVDSLRGGSLDLDAETVVAFARHRLVGAMPLQPGASLRTSDCLIEVLGLEPAGSGFIHVVVRFARFPSLTGSRPRLDLFKSVRSGRAAWLVRAPWPIATYNPDTTVDNWSHGRTWVGRFSFTIDRREPLPPAAYLAVVETTDAGSVRTRLTGTSVPIRVAPGGPDWIH